METVSLWGAEIALVELSHHRLRIIKETLLVHWIAVDAIYTIHCVPHLRRRTLLGAYRPLTRGTRTSLSVHLCSPLLFGDALGTHHQANIRRRIRHRHTVVLPLHCLHCLHLSLLNTVHLVGRHKSTSHVSRHTSHASRSR